MEVELRMGMISDWHGHGHDDRESLDRGECRVVCNNALTKVGEGETSRFSTFNDDQVSVI
jgi:hypothetical protein